MKDFFANKSVKILTVTLVLLIAAAILGAAGNPWVSSAFNFVTGGLSKVSAAVTAAAENKSYQELQEENERLKKEVGDLRAQLVDYYDIKDENARLWKYYDIKKSHADYEILPASVIRRDPNEQFASFTVDRGTSSGVELLDPVITENGLIGFVSSVNAVGSKVTTILSPDLQAGALDKKTGDSGVVSGNALYAHKNKTTLTKIDATSTVQKGDVVVTSGIGGIYPKNLIIGKVTAIKYDEYDATKYAVVESYEDIKKVTDVVILTGFKNKGEISGKAAATEAE